MLIDDPVLPRSLCHRYIVRSDGASMPVLSTPDAAIVRLAGDVVRICVEWGRAVSAVEVRPLGKVLVEPIGSDAVELRFPGPGSYCLECDGDVNYPLVILIEVEESCPMGDNITRVGPGHHASEDIMVPDGGVLYLEDGAWIDGGLRLVGRKDITILGRGTLDGVGAGTVPLYIEDCERITVAGPLLMSFEKWNAIVRCCRDVELRNLKIVSAGVCSDGIDVDGSERVRVSGCFVKCNDDCLCIKATPRAQGASVRDVSFTDCVLWNGPSGNAMEIGYESQCAEMRNISFQRITVLHVLDKPRGAWCDRQAALSMHITHDALVTNIRFEDITLEDVRAPKAIQFLVFHFSQKHGWFSPSDRLARGRIRNVHLKDIRFLQVRDPRIHIEGHNGPDDIAGVIFENVTFGGVPAQQLKTLNLELMNTQAFQWK